MASKTPGQPDNTYKKLLSLDDLDAAQLRELLSSTVEAHPGLEYEVNDRIEGMIQGTKAELLAAAIAAALELEEPRLHTYRAQYERWGSGLKARCPWEEVKSRLLAQNGRYFALAERLNEKSILFGVDEESNLLFADGGEEPIMIGMGYTDTRDRVLYEFDGDKIKQDDGKPVRTGYEMFPYIGDTGKSTEIMMFDENAGIPFVKHPGRDKRSSRGIDSWLESGENPSDPRYANYFEHTGCTGVSPDNFPQRRDPFRGVRRLLRVKKVA